MLLAHTEDMTKPINHTFFMLVRTTRPWLDLAPADRFSWLGTVIAPILGRHPGVSLRFFDSEAFNAQYSDVIMWETSDLMKYQSVVEELRETKFWGYYFEVVDIVASIENAFEIHYGKNPIAAS
jgi:hypothetical protein